MSDLAHLALDYRHRAANAGRGDEISVWRDGERDDRRWRGLRFTKHVASRREEIDCAVASSADNFSIWRNCHVIERRRQIAHDLAATLERPDPYRRVVARADDILSVWRECNAVDVLGVAFKDAWFAAIQRPKPNGSIPRRGGEHRAVRRHRHTCDRRRMAIKYLVGLLSSRRPDCDAGICAGGDDASVFQICNCIHGAIVKA